MTSIDPTDFVEAPEGSLSLKFNNEKQQAKFELGICMAVYKWDELNTAVENAWGGPKSADKRDWISGIVIDLFEEKVVDIQLVEETLLYAMVDEFDTEVDNDSALEIGALIINIYRDINIEKYDIVDSLFAKWQEKQNSKAVSANIVTINEDPNNPDDSDEEDEEEIKENDSHLAGNDDNMDIDDSGPIVDDDGFELVQKKGHRRH